MDLKNPGNVSDCTFPGFLPADPCFRTVSAVNAQTY